MADDLNRSWWFLVLRGIFAILFGFFAFLLPGITLASLILLFGAFALANGVVSLVMALRTPKGTPGIGSTVLLGLLGTAVGLLTFFFPGLTAISLLVLIASWAIVTGILEIVAAVKMRRQMKGSWMLVASGVLSLVFGGLLLLLPGPGALSLVWLIGAYAIAFGVLLLVSAFQHKAGTPMVREAPSTA